MFLKIFTLAILTVVTASAFAATDAEIAQWADEVLVKQAKTLWVRPGEARLISVYQLALNGEERKVPGQIYWDVDCYDMNSVKHTCVSTLAVLNKLGETGFGRPTMKSCYIGNSDKVCDLVKSEAAQLRDGHGSFGNIHCKTTGSVVAVSYTTDNDYDGAKNTSLTINSCL